MPVVFDGEIQEIPLNSGKYADIISPLDRSISQDSATSVGVIDN